MPGLFIMIKPVSGACDLACKYCFYRDETKNRERASYGSMSIAALECIIEKALSYADKECTFAFQGGEPFLRGREFYEHVTEFQKKYNQKGIKIENAIQTNGYSLDDKWGDFLARNHFLVGISLDGIKRTHDRCRSDTAGRGSFDRVMQSVSICERFRVDYNILTVVNRYTAEEIKRIYMFYKKHHFAFQQYIPCLDPLADEPGQQEYSLLPQMYGRFLKTLFDLWYKDVLRGTAPYIRQFENIMGMMLGLIPEACDQRGVCGKQYVIEADGSVYPCDFYVLDEYCLGNLVEDSFDTIDKRRQKLRFIETSSDFPSKCKCCDFLALCRGGCRRHRQFNAEGERLNYFCEAYQEFFAYSIDRWNELAERIKRDRTRIN